MVTIQVTAIEVVPQVVVIQVVAAGREPNKVWAGGGGYYPETYTIPLAPADFLYHDRLRYKDVWLCGCVAARGAVWPFWSNDFRQTKPSATT